MILGEAVVDGPPVPKARPRVTMRNGKAYAYTPRTTKQYEELIAWSWRGERCYAGAVRLVVEVHEGTKQHAADLDNYVKACGDALNGIAWLDDKQVTALTATIERKAPKPYLVARVEAMD